MNFIKNRLERRPDPLPKPQVFRHIQPTSSRGTTRSIHDSLNETLAAGEPYVVCAIAEGRGHAVLEVGLAAIDVSAPVLRMTQFSDNFWYSNVLTSLKALDPAVIYFSEHSLNSQSSTLPGVIRGHMPAVQIVPLARHFFNDVNAKKYMEDFCSSSYRLLKDSIISKYYGLAAIGALLRHCFESNILRIASKSLQFRYLNKQNTLAIDIECVGHLELIYSLQKVTDKHSLYWLLNHCITGVGKRHLRANLLEPSCCQRKLEARLEGVAELLAKADILCGVQRILRDLVDIGGLMRLSVDVDVLKTTKQNTIHVLNQACTLRSALRCVPELNLLLTPTESTVLKVIRQALSSPVYQLLSNKIGTVLTSGESVSSTADCHRLFLVKSGVCSTLDVLRGLYSEMIDEIREYIAVLSRDYSIPLKMSYSRSHGFHIQTNLKQNGNAPPPNTFRVLNRAGQRFSLTTGHLQVLNERVNGIIGEIETVSYVTIKELIEEIRLEVDHVYILVAHVTDLDLLQALTVVSQTNNYCRPTFGRSTKVVAARHPLLEAYGENEKVIKNNIIATPEYNVFIVTGPNMSGKTVYMKTICLLQIMAQLGSYVPATRAELRIADRLMAIFGAAENVEQDASNSLRMSRKLEIIGESLTVNSLVVIDELFGDTPCPSTASPRWKLLERVVTFIDFQPTADCKSLAAIGRPFVYLTTHCHDLLRSLDRFHNVSQLCMQTEALQVDGVSRLRYKYTVSEGKTAEKNYGISLARCVRMPESVILRAEEINKRLSAEFASHNTTTLNSTLSTEANRTLFDKRLYELYAQVASVLPTAVDGTYVDDERLGEQLEQLLGEFASSLSPDVVRFLKETPLEMLLRQNDQTMQWSNSTMPNTPSETSDNRATMGSEHFTVNETEFSSQESSDV
ncbi:mutS protein homolog 4-like [Sabethes cyaneus]|uniref:mutS protein homolog 4-like n=1 Tax=Sabethes cyaneus TaxID=53552 RepID=UPI00237DC409|nr:mutS protein homolog 4-like [Sabethes cyaneus]